MVSNVDGRSREGGGGSERGITPNKRDSRGEMKDKGHGMEDNDMERQKVRPIIAKCTNGESVPVRRHGNAPTRPILLFLPVNIRSYLCPISPVKLIHSHVTAPNTVPIIVWCTNGECVPIRGHGNTPTRPIL